MNLKNKKEIERFGRLISKERRAKGWSQETLAAEAFGNFTRRGHISNIENGKVKTITSATINKLQTALGLMEEQVNSIIITPNRSSKVMRDRWISANHKEINVVIAKLSENLQKLVSVIRTDNQLASSDEVMNSIQRAQLIAILEATLAELKAPNVNPKRALGWLGALKKVGKNAAEKESTERLRDAIDGVISEAGKLVKEASKSDGVSDLSNLF